MTVNHTENKSPWKHFFGPNLGYVEELYEQYKQDPESVDPEMREWFDTYGNPSSSMMMEEVKQGGAGNFQFSKKIVDAARLVWNIRTYGHMAADIDPINSDRQEDTRMLEPATYNLTRSDLESIPAELLWESAPANIRTGWDVYKRLREIYTQTLTFQFSHVTDVDERDWLNHKVESEDLTLHLSEEEKISLLRRLAQVEEFEQFLHRTFVGQKRFSIEGLDALVPMLDEIVRSCVKHRTFNILMGMAHRGRLNVLTHVLKKPYSSIFSEFHNAATQVPSEGSLGINSGWTGDVKYHFGAEHGDNKNDIRITLGNNPSHLEFIGPIVEGYARAAQEDRSERGFPKQDVVAALPVQIHGDAAFPGEGVVAETLNLSRLRGYQTGGTIHIIANNQLGFTTESSDARSTKYASDLAKGFEIPIVHVNADDPEACIAAMRLAVEYRVKFRKDFIVDLIGYRRFGHNEMDDPFPTQPQLYAKINEHPTVFKIYADKLIQSNIISQAQVDQFKKEVRETLTNAYDDLRSGKKEVYHLPGMDIFTESLKEPDIETKISPDLLRKINHNLLEWPEKFKVYPKLERILRRREKAFDEDGRVDWGHAEALAFASILVDGTPIRITGQDSERGTFAHRNLVLHDHKSGQTYSPLHELNEAKASFAIHNSPLSEVAVMGFEYGYNVYSPDTLVLWEAQYGDFVNVAQVIIDQFLSSGRAKWAQNSSLVLLLPHGYEGNGPEHSSARLERFLKLAAEDNWIVANLTKASQYFHLLRAQAKNLNKPNSKPLVIMTPKSLLRNPRATSVKADFTNGVFQKILEDPVHHPNAERVKRLILCSGKIAVDLQQQLETVSEEEKDWLHIIRIEQLYPFPKEEITQVFQRFSNVTEIMWVQEEPKNMGAWGFAEPRLREITSDRLKIRYVGRPDRSSTAEGTPDLHNIEQERIIREALMQSAEHMAETVSQGGGRHRE